MIMMRRLGEREKGKIGQGEMGNSMNFGLHNLIAAALYPFCIVCFSHLLCLHVEEVR